MHHHEFFAPDINDNEQAVTNGITKLRLSSSATSGESEMKSHLNVFFNTTAPPATARMATSSYSEKQQNYHQLAPSREDGMVFPNYNQAFEDTSFEHAVVSQSTQTTPLLHEKLGAQVVNGVSALASLPNSFVGSLHRNLSPEHGWSVSQKPFIHEKVRTRRVQPDPEHHSPNAIGPVSLVGQLSNTYSTGPATTPFSHALEFAGDRRPAGSGSVDLMRQAFGKSIFNTASANDQEHGKRQNQTTSNLPRTNFEELADPPAGSGSRRQRQWHPSPMPLSSNLGGNGEVFHAASTPGRVPSIDNRQNYFQIQGIESESPRYHQGRSASEPAAFNNQFQSPTTGKRPYQNQYQQSNKPAAIGHPNFQTRLHMEPESSPSKMTINQSRVLKVGENGVTSRRTDRKVAANTSEVSSSETENVAAQVLKGFESFQGTQGQWMNLESEVTGTTNSNDSPKAFSSHPDCHGVMKRSSTPICERQLKTSNNHTSSHRKQTNNKHPNRSKHTTKRESSVQSGKRSSRGKQSNERLSQRSGPGSNRPNAPNFRGKSNRSNLIKTGMSARLADHKVLGKDMSTADLLGHLEEFSRDSHGSRLVQRRMEQASGETKDKFVREILGCARSLMQDLFGNYVIQNFLQHASSQMRSAIVATMKGAVADLSTQPHGCRVVQKAMEVVSPQECNALMTELLHPDRIDCCAKDPHATHVLQKAVRLFQNDIRSGSATAGTSRTLLERVEAVVAARLLSLVVHQHACRLVQRVIGGCAPRQGSRVPAMLEEISQHFHALALDQHGNFVLQHILDKGPEEQAKRVQSFVTDHIFELAQHKFGSHLVEKCLVSAEQSEAERFVRQLLRASNLPQGGEGEGEEQSGGVLLVLMKDPYANFVVQRAFDVCGDELKQELASLITSHAMVLQRFTYGRHILAHVDRLMSSTEHSTV